MRKLLKILLVLLGGIAAIVLVAVLAVSLFFDPNDYKDRIESLVQSHIGRALAIEGDISLSFFPWLGVETGAAELADAPGFGPEPFARIEHAGVKVKLLPLLRRNVEVDTVILEGAVVHLARDAEGRTNWQDLMPAEREPTAAETAGGGLAGLALAGVQLRDSTVTWSDAGTGARYTASGIDLETSRVAQGEPFDLRLGADLKSASTGLDARLAVSARPSFETGAQTARLERFELEITGELAGAEGPPMPLDIRLDAEAALDLADGTGRLDELSLRAWNVEAVGSAQLSGLNATPAYTARLDVPEFSPRQLLERLAVDLPETSDEAVLQRAAAGLTAEGDAQSARMQLDGAYLDDTEIAGRFSIDPLAAMAMRFDLRIGALDLDRYLAPAQRDASDSTPLASPGEAVAAGGSLIPVETLRGLDLNGSVRAQRLVVAGLTATDITVTVNARDGQVRVHPLEAGFYQGRYTGDVRIDARGEAPMLSMDERLQGVQAGPLLEDAAGRAWMTGLGVMTLTSTADLSSPEAAKRSLSGRFELDFSDGAIFGVNIAQRIRQAVALLEGGAMTMEGAEEKTDFSSFRVNADMDGGVIRARTVQLVSPLFQLDGGGTIDLVQDRLDLTFTPVLSEALIEQSGGALRRLSGRQIPLRFSGSLLQPEITLDLASALEGRVRDEARDRLGRELLRRLGEDQDEKQPQEEEPPPADDDNG